MTRTSTMQLSSHYILLLNFIAVVQASVSSFTIRSGDIPTLGGNIDLLCIVTGNNAQTGNAYIYKAGIETELSACSAGSCSPDMNYGYTFSSSGNVITVTIPSLSSADNNVRWTCTQKDSKYLDLQVYSIPTSLVLDGSAAACDLGASDCTFVCKTNSCTYPSPAFTWLYSQDNGKTTTVFSNIGNILPSSTTNGCTSPAQTFIQTLSLTRYTTFNNNARKTIQIQCKIHFAAFQTISRHSSLSSDVIFAVKVSTVTIYDGQHALTSNEIMNVNEFEPTTLSCTAGYGHPTPTVQWYIGTTYKWTGSTFTFSLTNSLHGQPIYCVADNIPNDNNDATSNTPRLYIKVKIKYVYIESAEDSSISVIEDTPEPVICATSGGRPGSTIRWLKLTSGQENDLGEGDSLDFSSTGYLLNITKSTKLVQMSRPDSGWTLSCSASNLVGAAPIEANNSKTFKVLYSPEKMIISYSGHAVENSRIDVTIGANVSLLCSAVSNPSVHEYKWNIDSIKDETLIIKNIQENKMVNCTARNIMVSSSGNTVDGYSSISKEVNVLYQASIERMFVQLVGTTLKNVNLTVEENDSLSIACLVDSNPGSTISLLQATVLLTDRKNSKKLVYNITSATCNHTSEYTCKAWNGVKDGPLPAEKKIQLNVRCSPRAAIGTDSSVVAQQNTSTVISITLLAYPVPKQYTWYKNSSNTWKQLTNSSSIQLTQASLQFNLTIKQVKAEDYGEYKLNVTNGIGDPYSYTFVLEGHGDKESQTGTPDDGLAGIIGGVVGGLLVACLVILGVVCFLRRRNRFEGMKTKLFGPKSTTSRDELNHASEEIKPQDEGYSYALVDKPKGGKGLNIVKESNVSETMQEAENTTSQPTGYLYSVVNKEAGENKMKIVQEQEAKESAAAKGKTKKTKGEKKTKTKQNAKDNAAAPTGDDDRCYENPMVLTESNSKVKPPKKGKPVKAKDTKPISQDHDGLQYVEVSFSDIKKSGKKKKAAKPKVDDRTVYDPVQFGVVGEAYPSSEEEDNTKK